MALKTRGLIQIFAQAGLPVLASYARVPIVDNILANIAVTEDTKRALSTYEKVNRTTWLAIRRATTRSLLLLDEPTSGTYDLKAVAQAEVYIRALAASGYETWLVTHHLQLTGLAREHPEIVNLTTGVRDGSPTYRIVPGEFKPVEGTVVLDYPTERVRGVIKGDRVSRLQELERMGLIPAKKREVFDQVYKPKL